MAIETSVNIDVNVDGTATVKQAAQGFEDLGDAVAKTQRQAEALALQYGVNDQRTQEAIKTAARYKYELEQLDAAIDLNRSSMELLISVTNSLINGFQAAIGAVAIFGEGSEDLTRQLIKLQGAMAFTEALKNLREELPKTVRALRARFIELNTTLSTTQKLMRGLGLGLAIAGLIAIAKNFDFIIQKAKNLLDRTGLTNFRLQDQIKIQEKLYNDKARALALLENEYVSEEDALKRQQEILLEKEKLASEEVKLNELRLEYARFSKEDIAEAEDAYLNSVNNQKIAAENLVKFDLENKKKLEQQQIDFNIQQFNLQVEQIQDRKDTIKALQDLDNQYLLSTYKINEDYYKANDESIGLVEKRRKTSSIFKTKEAEDEYRREKIRLRQQKEAELKILEEAFLKQIITEKQYRDYIAQLNAYYDEQNENAQKNRELARLDQIQSLTQQSFQIISDLNDAFTSDQQKKSEAQFKFQKGLNVAFTLIDTYLAAQKAYTSQIIPADPTSIVRAQIAAGVAIAAGLARVAAIVRTQFNKQSPALASSGGGSSTVQSFQVRSSSLPQTQDILSQNRLVYVLEGDITRTQRRVASNQSVSVLGG